MSENPNLRSPDRGPHTVNDVQVDKFSSRDKSQILELDTSGSHGQHGAHGFSHTYPANPGGVSSDGFKGQRGGDATAGEHAESAGDIITRLSMDHNALTTRYGLEYDPEIFVRANLRGPGRKGGEISRTMGMPVNPLIIQRANGGHGGQGGDGGHGQQGGRGGDGRNATRHRRGTNGGDGGDGGDGGHGGRGGDGGNGGNITGWVQAGDLHLLTILESEIALGRGGAGGRGGHGGRGGSGGRGGRAKVWTDSDGNWRRKAGGRRGSDGYPGRNGGNGRDGKNAQQGSVRFQIYFPTGNVTRTYSKLFRLEIVDFMLVDAFEDGIWEFGERLYIRFLRVRNSGEVALPGGRTVYLMAECNEWILSDPIALAVPRTLKPGESYQFQEELAVVIRRPHRRSIGESPLIVKGQIDPFALMGGVQRRLYHGARNKSISIQFPATISQVRAHHSIARGDATRITWTVKNICKKPLGEETDLGRWLGTEFVLSPRAGVDRLQGEHILFFDDEGQPMDLEEGILRGIAALPEGVESGEIGGYIGIHPGAEPMTATNSAAELKLAIPDDPNQPETVQLSSFQLRVAKTYSKTPESDFLLVINKDTHIKTVEDILGWFERIGS
ncbi:MAG: hypothetical protein AAF570_11835, partial [Bacteroidota bacterium]